MPALAPFFKTVWHSSFKPLVGAVALALLSSTAYAERAIALYYDDSGSMISPNVHRWYAANYSAQLLSSLKSPSDELYLAKMTSPHRAEKIQSVSQVDAFIAQMQKEPPPNANTPYDGMTTLLDSLSKSTADEKWLVVVTDGMMDVSTQAKAEQLKQDKARADKLGIRTVFVLVEEGADRQLAEFWNADRPQYIIETTAQGLTGIMSTLATTITGRDSQGLQITQTGKVATVSSVFPLRNLVVIAQGQHKVGVTHAELLSASGSRPLTLSTHNIALHEQAQGSGGGLPQFGSVSHLSFGGSADTGDEKADIHFNDKTDGLTLAILPEVAARLDIEVLDTAGNPLTKNAEGHYPLCTGDTAELRAKLTADSGKSLIGYAKDTALFDVGFLAGSTVLTANVGGDYFSATISPTTPTKLHPFAKYPNYFNFQSQPISLVPEDCIRTIDIVNTTQLDSDGRWVRSLDNLDDGRLEYSVSLNGKPAPKAMIDGWMWTQGDDNWRLHTADGKIWLTPKTPCCALFWQRPKAGVGKFALTLTTNRPQDTINNPAPIAYEFKTPQGLAYVWWLICPFVVWLGAMASVWYLWRILFIKQRFHRRAKLHIYEANTRLKRPRALVPNKRLLSHWLLPVKHETVQLEGLSLHAIGKTTILIKGTGLTEFHEIPNWSYDETRPTDARLTSMQMIELYDNRGKLVKLIQFTAKGETDTISPEDYR